MEREAAGGGGEKAGDVLLTVAEVAAELRVHREVVRRWLRSGELPGLRLPSRVAGWRVSRRELDGWLRERSLRRRAPSAAAG